MQAFANGVMPLAQCLGKGGPTKGLAKSAADGLTTSKAIGCSQEFVEAPSEVQEGAGLHAACLPCEQRVALENTISSNCVELTSQKYLKMYKMCVLIRMADNLLNMQFLTLPMNLTQSGGRAERCIPTVRTANAPAPSPPI